MPIDSNVNYILNGESVDQEVLNRPTKQLSQAIENEKSSSADANTIAVRDSSGRLKASSPVALMDLVNLQYLDSNYQKQGTNNLGANRAPTVNDDENDGYGIFSKWVDISQTPAEVYICVDNAAGAAIWLLGTLTLEDLGSAATKELATLNQALSGGSGVIPDAEQVLATIQQFGVGTLLVSTEADLDNLTDNGFYWHQRNDSQNQPTTRYSFIDVKKEPSGNILQIIYDRDSSLGNTYYRSSSDNGVNWSSWVENFDSRNTLDIGKTSESARTALNLADSATISAKNLSGRDNRVTVSGGDLEIGTMQHIINSNTFTLPVVGGLGAGRNTVVLTKDVTATPTIQVEGGSNEVIQIGKNNEVSTTDTSVIFDINSEIIFSWNGNNWEI